MDRGRFAPKKNVNELCLAEADKWIEYFAGRRTAYDQDMLNKFDGIVKWAKSLCVGKDLNNQSIVPAYKEKAGIFLIAVTKFFGENVVIPSSPKLLQSALEQRAQNAVHDTLPVEPAVSRVAESSLQVIQRLLTAEAATVVRDDSQPQVAKTEKRVRALSWRKDVNKMRLDFYGKLNLDLSSSPGRRLNHSSSPSTPNTAKETSEPTFVVSPIR